MRNFIHIFGQEIELTAEQAEKIRASLGASSVRLSSIAAGDTFKIGEHEFVVLEHSGDTTAVILKDLLIERKRFGENNNYNGSYVEQECNQFADKIEAIVGAENIVKHTVDLTSDDGLKDYGKIKRRASLLTTELYRRYVYLLDKHKVDKWWWLATAWSTPAHDDESLCKCVSPSGRVSNNVCNSGGGVRPFCILKSHIFVSK